MVVRDERAACGQAITSAFVADRVEDEYLDRSDRSADGCARDIECPRETAALPRTRGEDLAPEDTLHDVHIRPAAIQNVLAVTFPAVKQGHGGANCIPHAALRPGPFRIIVPAMAHILEHRRGGPDRRRLPRGGRRADDGTGFAPLVLLVGGDADVVGQSEAVLAKLHFAVATSGTVDAALRVMTGLRPDIVVANAEDAARIRLESPEHVPVVVLDDVMRSSREALVEGIRETIRANPKPE